MSGKRLDIALVEQGFIKGRDNAKRAIEQGIVYVNGIQVLKPSHIVESEDKIVADIEQKFVGRGGYKLEKALITFDIELKDKLCMDIGASTGGFTDCMLRYRASEIYAIEVGSEQMAPSLLANSSVHSYENTDIRTLPEDIASIRFDFIACDISFISLTIVMFYIQRQLSDNGCAILLIKPQFEAGRSAVGKNGIVRDIKNHISAIEKVISSAAENKLYTAGLTYSPIKGGKGNIEYLLYLTKNETEKISVDSEKTTTEAFENL